MKTPVSRALRAMAIVRWLLLVFVAAVAAGTWWAFVVREPPTVDSADHYFCPMHPQIRSPVAGTCPICFMKLEPIRRDEEPKHSTGTAPSGLSNVMLTYERRRSAGIATSEVSRRSVARNLDIPAVIEVPQRGVAEVRVRTPAFVERVASVETGTRVRAGDPLLWVYSPEIFRAEEELLAATRFRAAEENSDAKSHHELGSKVKDVARERLVLLGLAAQDIERIERTQVAERIVPIRAPTSGTVTAREVAVGTQATPEVMLLQITDLSSVWATASVAAGDLKAIAIGTKGRFIARADGRSHDVEARLVEPRVSAGTRTALVRFEAKNADGTLFPGEIGDVAVLLPAEEHILVPRDAVVDTGVLRYVFVEISEGLFGPRVIELGPMIGSEQVVLHGIEVGDRVVSRGAFMLDSESRIAASLRPEAPPEVAP